MSDSNIANEPEMNDDNGKTGIWNRVLRSTLSLPGARVNRATYLKNELSKHITAAVVAGKTNGGYDGFADAQRAMTGMKEIVYRPITENHKVYQQLYALYKQLHDAFGTADYKESLHNVMKDLLDIKEKANT